MRNETSKQNGSYFSSRLILYFPYPFSNSLVIRCDDTNRAGLVVEGVLGGGGGNFVGDGEVFARNGAG